MTQTTNQFIILFIDLYNIGVKVENLTNNLAELFNNWIDNYRIISIMVNEH